MKARIVGCGRYYDTSCFFCGSNKPSLFVVLENDIKDVPACNKCIGAGKLGEEAEVIYEDDKLKEISNVNRKLRL